MGIEGPSQSPSFESSKVPTQPRSLGNKASHRTRTVERLSAGNDQTKPCNSGLVERSPGSGGVDTTVNRVFGVVDTPRVELSNTPFNADEAFLADLKKRFAAFGEEGITAPKGNPLHYAAGHGLIQSVQFLLSVGDKQQCFDLRDKKQNNLVHLAAKKGHTRLLHLLIDQYGSMALTQRGSHGFLAMHHAARGGHLECVQLLLTYSNNGLFDDDEWGNNPIHWATRSGNPKVLQRMADQYYPHIFALSAGNGLRPLQIAIHLEHVDCIECILETCPDTIKLKDKVGQNAIHHAAGMGKTEILNVLIPWAEPEDLLAQDDKGNTALHLAAGRGHKAVVEVLLNTSEEILGIKNDFSSNAAHLAAAFGHLPILKQIMRRDMKTILEAERRGKTPLHAALQAGHVECVKWLLINASVRRNLTRIDPYSTLFSDVAQCQSLLARARKELAEPSRPQAPCQLEAIHRVGDACEWPPTHLKKKNLMSRAGEWPEFSAQHKQRSSPFVDQAKAVLTRLGSAGIYLANNVYSVRGETKDKFWSTGDLNAGVQMAKTLQGMGLESLEVVLAPPDYSSRQRRMEYNPDQRADYARLQEIARYKLARLWPGVDPEKPLPQVLKQDTCLVTFRECDDPAPPPQVMFSFRGVKEQLRDTGKLPEIGVVLKPYRYGRLYQQIVADIHDGRGNILPLNLPPNSVIPGVHCRQPDDGLSPDTSLLAGLVNHLGRHSQAAKIDLSVVYGLHHRAISDPERVLKKWAESIREIASTAGVKKPVIIAVASNIILEDSLPVFASNMKLPLLDLGAIVRASTADREGVARAVREQIDNLPPGDLAICILPSLPKQQFEELVLSSRLPVLTEGANLTSFLLEHGRPHLSLLPSGCTTVAQDMGDPFEAIKAEAFASKLSMDEDSLTVLTALESLLEREGVKAYQEALQRIDALAKKEALAFLWRNQEKDTFLGLEQLSIRKLLEKGSINGTLGKAGKKALMSALDSSSQGLMQYIRDAMSEESPTAMHFKLQQMHLEGPSVNAINSALVRLGRYKGWIH